jgi:hypothetical protein
MSFRVEGETQILFSKCGISCSSNSWHCWFSIKTKINFSLVGIFTNLKQCHLQSDNLNRIFFC